MSSLRKFPWRYLAISASIFSVVLGHSGRSDPPPTVDLGYEIRQGTVNETGNYYVFNNIAYAQQPVGDLRFKKPVAIVETEGPPGHEHGNDDVVMCPQAYPQWVINLLAQRSGIDNTTMASMLNDQAGQTEACLVLDVYVPTHIFDEGPTANASVLVWIHGGGFTFGSKNLYGNPAGLIARSQEKGHKGSIIVSINYRLGMYGWLAGQDVTPNLGLYDQRLALDWINNYIVLFGGGINKMTVMGESAGAASIVHQLTAFGATESCPFTKAIILSPAFQYNIDLDGNYLKTLAEASKQTGRDIYNVDQLRGLPADLLQYINQETVTTAPVGTFGFGPGPDKDIVTDIPQKLLYQGKFDSTVDLLISHTSHESVPFLPSGINTAADVKAYVRNNLPAASNTTINMLLTDRGLYPDVLGGKYPWKTQAGRAERLASDISFACTTQYLSRARGNDTFNLVFTHPPGWHADDVPYVFFNGDTSTPDNMSPVSGRLATQLQAYIVAFTRTGDPNASGGPYFPKYGRNSTILELGYKRFRRSTDDLWGKRCAWIQQAMVDGKL
ncbi:alpha/beta-hydrolase [Daldinia decipiens]|uniref:alpha/beta-hydrolase n=1 Tax=Daldinia decipiens TaxID=326647 RepID=UPI0020C38301|nr:alpha/beta-hydrolase [Daldinia decipiens]KAI1660386.1 alpha/beta-hydrolase [Daldinia decipiens]